MNDNVKRRMSWAVMAMALAAPARVSLARSAQEASQPASQPSSTAPASRPAKPAPEHLRIIEDKGKSISLQIASRDYKKMEGAGPTIALVGVAHIGDLEFYRSVEKLLEQYDVVLYESVKPPGAGGAGGDTDNEKIESTEAAMQFVGGLIETYKRQKSEYPADLNSLATFAQEKDSRIVKFLSVALLDAWGRPLVYERLAPPTPPAAPPADVTGEAPAPSQPEARGYKLVSLGADGAPAGEGVNADLDLADHAAPEALPLSKEDGLQTQLADALGLEFQLDALPYDKANWRCSDMAMDEVSRRLEAKGLNFDEIGGTLAGSSLPAKIIKVLLGLMKTLDVMFEGAITDMFKVVMIEMLGDEKMITQGVAQFGEGFSEVIVGDRNQVAIDDLKKLLETEPQVKSVAVLYGAAHMPDMAKRMREQLGYEPAPASEIRWLTAMTVDLSKSPIPPSEMNQIRLMIRRAIREQLRASRAGD